jgi:hypothetical protein
MMILVILITIVIVVAHSSNKAKSFLPRFKLTGLFLRTGLMISQRNDLLNFQIHFNPQAHPQMVIKQKFIRMWCF